MRRVSGSKRILHALSAIMLVVLLSSSSVVVSADDKHYISADDFDDPPEVIIWEGDGLEMPLELADDGYYRTAHTNERYQGSTHSADNVRVVALDGAQDYQIVFREDGEESGITTDTEEGLDPNEEIDMDAVNELLEDLDTEDEEIDLDAVNELLEMLEEDEEIDLDAVDELLGQLDAEGDGFCVGDRNLGHPVCGGSDDPRVDAQERLDMYEEQGLEETEINGETFYCGPGGCMDIDGNLLAGDRDPRDRDFDLDGFEDWDDCARSADSRRQVDMCSDNFPEEDREKSLRRRAHENHATAREFAQDLGGLVNTLPGWFGADTADIVNFGISREEYEENKMRDLQENGFTVANALLYGAEDALVAECVISNMLDGVAWIEYDSSRGSICQSEVCVSYTAEYVDLGEDTPFDGKRYLYILTWTVVPPEAEDEDDPDSWEYRVRMHGDGRTGNVYEGEVEFGDAHSFTNENTYVSNPTDNVYDTLEIRFTKGNPRNHVQAYGQGSGSTFERDIELAEDVFADHARSYPELEDPDPDSDDDDGPNRDV